MSRVRAVFLVVAMIASFASSVASSARAAEPTTYAPDESEVFAPVPSAERPACPTAPEPAAEGADAAVVEQRLSRIESDQVCAVVSQRLGEVAERLWWVVSEQLRQHSQGVSALERQAESVTLLRRLEPIAEALSGELSADVTSWSAGTLAVRDSAAVDAAGESVEGQSEVSEAIDAGAEATRSALWYLIGVAAGAFVGYLFYRQVMPRA